MSNTCADCFYNQYGFVKFSGTDEKVCRLLLGIPWEDCDGVRFSDRKMTPIEFNYGVMSKMRCDLWRSQWTKIREFTPEEESLFRELNDARKAFEEAQERFYRTEHKCKHPVLQVNKWDDTTGIVHCAICGEDLGWWCPDNPDRRRPYCKYDGEKDHAHDICVYCGAPEERK